MTLQPQLLEVSPLSGIMLRTDLQFEGQLIHGRKEDEDFLEWLSPGPARSYWLVEAQLCALRKQRASNTLQWLSNMEEFRNWCSMLDAKYENRNPILWIKGAPGVGKSTMAAYLVDLLRCLFPESIVAYFFCKSSSAGLTNPQDIVQTLAYQCMENSAARSSLEALKRSGFRTENKVGISLMFEKLVEEPVRCSKKEICIVLDGLDEADDECEDEIERRPQLQILLDCLATLAPARLIILSRPQTSLHKAIPTAIIKSITSKDNEADIRAYVQIKIAGLEHLQRHFETLGLDPVNYFVEKANGVFLWAFLVLQQFKLSSEMSRKAFERDLKDLSEASGHSQLDKRFSIALLRNSHEEVWVKQILLLLVTGMREITVEELQAAVETNLDDHKFNFHQFLEVNCGSFLRLIPNSQESPAVQLIHETFASFLVDPDRCKPSTFYINKAIAHAEVAILCLRVLTSDNAETNPFLQYASTFWVDHLTHSTTFGEASVKLLINIFHLFTSSGVEMWVKHSLSKSLNFQGFQVSVEEQSLEAVIYWLLCHRVAQTLPTDPHVEDDFQASQWSASIVQATDEEEERLGRQVGQAAARVWAQYDLPDFNQTATCFSLGMKYYIKEHKAETSSIDVFELETWVAKRLRDPCGLSQWAFGKAVAVEPKSIAVAFFTLRKWEQCVLWFTAGGIDRSKKTGGFKALRYLGEAYMGTRQYSKAIETFIAATEENPADSLSWIGLGQGYRAIGDLEEAVKAFKLASEKNPGDVWFHKALGDLYVDSGDYSSAVITFQKAIEDTPTDSSLWSKLGYTYEKNEELDAAIKIFEEATKKFPMVRRLWSCLRNAYYALGDRRATDIEAMMLKRFADFPFPWKIPSPPADLYPSQRTVWLFTRVVQSSRSASFTGGSPLESSVIITCNNTRREAEKEFRSETPLLSRPLVHELWNNSGTAEYRSRPLLPKDVNPSFNICYIGETILSDMELGNIGIET